MYKCKIGIRNNLYYPLMLIIFISLLKVDEILLNNVCKYQNTHFIISLLIFISQFCAGFFVLLFQNKSEIIRLDKKIKINILIILASYFNYIGTIIRNQNTDFELENRTRGFQIIFCAILCYFTIRTKIYKHQIFSLIIIFIIFIFILVIDFFLNEKKFELLISYGCGIFSCFSRAFLDTIEKYLFEFDYLNPYKVLMLEGFIGCLFIPILFFFDLTYVEINSFKNNYNFVLLIILLYYIFFINLF